MITTTASALVFFGGILLLGALIAAVETLIERRCVKRDRLQQRRELRQRTWREISQLRFDDERRPA